MKLEIQKNKVQTSDNYDFDSIEANIDVSKFGKMWEFFSNIYKDSISSIVREITSNCFDSHKKAGVNDAVIINMDKDESGYYIEFVDVGTGLSPKTMRDIYMNYLSSDKEDSNEFIGAFGLGSKSPFSYVDVFYIETIADGIKYNYILRKGEVGPVLDKINEMPIDKRNGTIIKIYIKKLGDINDFLKAIYTQLRYFDNVYLKIGNSLKPTLNSNFIDLVNDINEFNIYEGKHFKFRPSNVKSNALFNNISQSRVCLCIGKVYYPIDYNLCLKESKYKGFMDLPIALKIDIGEIPVNYSREDIRYNQNTIAIIEKRFEEACVEIIHLIAKQINKETSGIKTDKDLYLYGLKLFRNNNNIFKYLIFDKNKDHKISINDIFRLDRIFTSNYKTCKNKYNINAFGDEIININIPNYSFINKNLKISDGNLNSLFNNFIDRKSLKPHYLNLGNYNSTWRKTPKNKHTYLPTTLNFNHNAVDIPNMQSVYFYTKNSDFKLNKKVRTYITDKYHNRGIIFLNNPSLLDYHRVLNRSINTSLIANINFIPSNSMDDDKKLKIVADEYNKNTVYKNLIDAYIKFEQTMMKAFFIDIDDIEKNKATTKWYNDWKSKNSITLVKNTRPKNEISAVKLSISSSFTNLDYILNTPDNHFKTTRSNVKLDEIHPYKKGENKTLYIFYNENILDKKILDNFDYVKALLYTYYKYFDIPSIELCKISQTNLKMITTKKEYSHLTTLEDFLKKNEDFFVDAYIAINRYTDIKINKDNYINELSKTRTSLNNELSIIVIHSLFTSGKLVLKNEFEDQINKDFNSIYKNKDTYLKLDDKFKDMINQLYEVKSIKNKVSKRIKSIGDRVKDYHENINKRINSDIELIMLIYLTYYRHDNVYQSNEEKQAYYAFVSYIFDKKMVKKDSFFHDIYLYCDKYNKDFLAQQAFPGNESALKTASDVKLGNSNTKSAIYLKHYNNIKNIYSLYYTDLKKVLHFISKVSIAINTYQKINKTKINN